MCFSNKKIHRLHSTTMGIHPWQKLHLRHNHVFLVVGTIAKCYFSLNFFIEILEFTALTSWVILPPTIKFLNPNFSICHLTRKVMSRFVGYSSYVDTRLNLIHENRMITIYIFSSNQWKIKKGNSNQTKIFLISSFFSVRGFFMIWRDRGFPDQYGMLAKKKHI